jgi:hypothetical protein
MAGGGVGEAMLIGAAVGATAGGAGAAIQGGDPLQGALLGGAMGGVGGGIGGYLGGAGSTALPTVTTAGTGAGSGLTAGAAAGTTAGTTLGTTTGGTFGSLTGGTGASLGAGTGSTFGSLTGGAVPVASTVPISSGIAGAAPGGAAAAISPTTQSLANAGIAAPGNFTGFAPQLSNLQLGMTAGTAGLAGLMQAERDQFNQPTNTEYDGPLKKLKYDPDKFNPSNPVYAPGSVYRPTYAAEGGIMQAFQSGGPVERMSQMNTAINPQGGMYPQGMIDKTQYALPTQRPTSMEVIDAGAQRTFASGGIARFNSGGLGIDAIPGNKKRMLTKEQMDAVALQGMSKEALNDIYGQMAAQGLAKGGQLGGYSDGGRMLKGPGDGMSDSIPGVIANKQPARLADGEFVVPADVVSHLGNGSTDAGAKQLYAMMNRVRKARTGNPKQGKQIKPAKYMAA